MNDGQHDRRGLTHAEADKRSGRPCHCAL